MAETKNTLPKFFELIRPGTSIKFIQHRWRFISLSLLLVAISLASMIYNYATTGAPLNMGIDFAGGSQVQLAFKEGSGVEVEAVRTALEELGYEGSSAVEVPDRDNEILVRIKETVSIEESTLAACQAAVEQVGDAKLVDFNHPEGGSKLFITFDAEPSYREVARRLEEAGCRGTVDKGTGGGPTMGPTGEEIEAFPVEVALVGIGAKVSTDLESVFGAGAVDHIVRAETVGSKVGNQLQTDGIKSLLFAIGFIFLYVMFRFDLRFAPGGILALIHDAFLVVGAFALTGKEFNLQTIAAVLTVVGYSINDTIVVFDRIRERVALYRDANIEETSNAALNDTLSRTLLTTLTTLMVVVATYVLGSGPIKDFAFALIVGMVVGTYSSLYIATPVFLWVNRRFYGGKGHLAYQQQPGEGEGTGMLLRGDADKAGPEAAAEGFEVAAEGGVQEATDGDVAAAENDALAGARKTTSRRRRRRRPEGGAPEGSGTPEG
jgi:preprotein translocase subunit SecF